MSKFKQFRENLQYLTNNTLTSNKEAHRSTSYDIKSTVDISCDNIYSEVFKALNYNLNKQYYFNLLIKSIYDETNPFYKVNVRTATFQTMINKVNSRILNNFTIFDNDTEVEESIELDLGDLSAKLDVDDQLFYNLSENLLLYDESYIKLTLSDDGLIYTSVDPTQVIYSVDTNSYTFIYREKDDIVVEVRVDSTIDYYYFDFKTKSLELFKSVENNLVNDGVYKVKSSLSLVNKGLLEQILLYSESFSAFQKEQYLSTPDLFIDQQYINNGHFNTKRDYYQITDTPDSGVQIDDTPKPIFEKYQPEFRSEQYRVARDFIKDEIATIMQLDKASLGLSTDFETATASLIKSSQTQDTINLLKKQIEIAINSFLQDLTNLNDYYVRIEKYSPDDPEYVTNYLQKQVASNLVTVKTGVKTLHSDWTEDEVNIEYLTLMYQSSKPFTKDEEALAIMYGILENPELTQTEDNLEENGTVLQ